MSYNANIPQATDAQDVSQPELLANFQSISTLIQVNHVNFDDPSGNQGKHYMVEFPAVTTPPSGVSGEIIAYSATSSLTSAVELNLLKATGSAIPITACDKSSTGWAYLPSGLLIKWGQTAANGSTNITFPTGGTIPVFNGVLTAQITTAGTTVNDTNTFVRLSSISTTTLQVYGSIRAATGAAACTFNYLVIGY